MRPVLSPTVIGVARVVTDGYWWGPCCHPRLLVGPVLSPTVIGGARVLSPTVIGGARVANFFRLMCCAVCFFVLCLSSSCVSGLSILYCPFGFR